MQVNHKAFSAVGYGDPVLLCGPFTLGVWGTFVGTWVLQRSSDGVTWRIAESGTTATELDGECKIGMLYRMGVSAYTSGAVEMEISQ